mmetsp:Transcript_3623/g.5876  ORF Transcript_3623/g.5876 Transcript_3623/m.5876 type:complete len:231 (+) Transcript_3623:95-787(+)
MQLLQTLKRNSHREDEGASLLDNQALGGAQDAYEPGGIYQVLSTLTVREDEDLNSPVVRDVPERSRVQVLAVGSGRRLQVAVLPEAEMIGWVSCCTAAGQQLLALEADAALASPASLTPAVFSTTSEAEAGCYAPFFVGSVGRVLSEVIIRQSVSLDSDFICELPVGSRFRIEELANERRARVRTTNEVTGWLSIRTKHGDPLVDLVASENPVAGACFRNQDIRSYPDRI